MKLEAQVDKMLKRMRTNDMKQKGSSGEQAIMIILEEMLGQMPSLLYWSYSYPGVPGMPGNIKKEGDKFKEYSLTWGTEIDVLFITEYRIFVIEVKSYSSKLIVLTDDEIRGVKSSDKSPVHQNEMHCRHLYHQIYPIIPQGNPNYIVPMVVFVDKCTVDDQRSEEQKKYIPVTILNNVRQEILERNIPLDYRIDLRNTDKKLGKLVIKNKLERRSVNFGNQL